MIYCHICDNCGSRIEKHLPMSACAMLFKCEKCGEMMRRDLIAEHGGFDDTPGNWPQESDAAGVNPCQIPEAMAYARKMGVPTNYNPKTGAAIMTGRIHRQKFHEISGLYDRSAGWADQSPHHNMRKRKRRVRHAG